MATRAFEIKIKDADINAIRRTFKNMDQIAQDDMNRAANPIALGVEFGSYQDRPRKRKGKSTDYVGYRQFQPRSPREGRGNAGYFIFPTLKTLQPEITKRWVEQVDRIRREWRERN